MQKHMSSPIPLLFAWGCGLNQYIFSGLKHRQTEQSICTAQLLSEDWVFLFGVEYLMCEGQSMCARWAAGANAKYIAIVPSNVLIKSSSQSMMGTFRFVTLGSLPLIWWELWRHQLIPKNCFEGEGGISVEAYTSEANFACQCSGKHLALIHLDWIGR